MQWEIKKIGDICKTGAGGTPVKRNKEYYLNGNIPWLLSGEVCQKNILKSKNFITKKGLKNSSAKLFPVQGKRILIFPRMCYNGKLI